MLRARESVRPVGPVDPEQERFRITEIFHSLQGEALEVGLPTVFVRLTGCPLRCVYCDTTYSFHGGETRGLAEILETVGGFGTPHVCVTGGEPLAQKNCPRLLQALCDSGYRVTLETSGALSVAGVDPRVIKVMDLKTPSSGECERNDLGNLDYLSIRDQVKFVIRDRADYDWAVECVHHHHLGARHTVLFSPVADVLEPGRLADWILADRLPVRFQMQLHKLLWGDEPGR